MSSRSGHRSKADIARKKKSIRREKTIQLRKELAGQAAVATSLVEAETKTSPAA